MVDIIALQAATGESTKCWRHHFPLMTFCCLQSQASSACSVWSRSFLRAQSQTLSTFLLVLYLTGCLLTSCR